MKRKVVKNLLIVFTLMSLWLAVGLAMAAPPDNYTANMVVGGMVMPMAKMGNKVRFENPMMRGMVTINLMDVRKTITISTVNKTYFEQTSQEKVPSFYDRNVVFEKKKIGSETIDSHPCIKYDTVFYSKDKPAEKFKAVIWEAQDLGGLPIRNEAVIPEDKRSSVSGGKIVSEIKWIKIGAATPSMFQVPNGYKKVNSIQEVMGMGTMGDVEKMGEMMKKMKKGMKRPGEE